MKHSFSILLTMCILMVVGAALIPKLDIADKPLPRQGKTLTISYSWWGTAAKVIEQNVTSRIEGLVCSVKGVESVSSESRFGSGTVTIHLKKDASVSGVKFEISSILRQMRDKFPQGVSYPELSGGEVTSSRIKEEKNRPLLSYQINADLPDREIRQLVEKSMKLQLEKLEDINRVEVTGGNDIYMEISYDAEQLALHQLTSSDIASAISNYLGKEDIIGDVIHKDKKGERERITLSLMIEPDMKGFETIPVKTIGDKIVYLNNLATVTYKEKDPYNYYRVNGMNTVYMNVYAQEDANIRRTAGEVKDMIEKAQGETENQETKVSQQKKLTYTTTYDRAEEQLSEFNKLIVRSGMSLLILLLFVYFSKRNVKYLFIIASTLLANILIAVIFYWLLGMRLHPFSIAGITVSLGLIIDSTIVMVDHYSYHHNHQAFHGILGAMLTTIGSLVIIFWLPDYLKNDLYDFSWMVMINLAVAVLVSALFAPALVSKLGYTSMQAGKPHHLAFITKWNGFYKKYLSIAWHRIFRWPLLVLTAGAFAWSLYLFIDTLGSNTYSPPREEMKLNIQGRMPLGGTAKQLNEKVEQIEAFLSQYKEIKRYETNVSGWGSSIIVEFKPEYLKTGFPYKLENKVISKLITIGGADWSTYGVSDRGFSNSLNLQYRSNSIEIAGYDYDRLYRFAEDMCKRMSANNRVMDLSIETPGHQNQEEELYMDYDREKLAQDSVRIQDIHSALSSLLIDHLLMANRQSGQQHDIILRPNQYEGFDLWQLDNSYVKVGGRDVRVSDYMKITHREAKNCIPRENQEYTLSVAFNVLGSYTYTYRYIKSITDEFNAKFPVGFRCLNSTYGYYEDNGTQYWLIGLVAVIIFFICSILFESLYQAMVIILLIPASLTGMFLTYHFGGVEFGTGGYAAMVLLCGLTVNAGIYLMNEYNRNGRHYLRAYNHKIIPIFLTVLSTILGLIPFLIDGPEERFWFSFAIGSISGLASSIFALVFVMPMMMKRATSHTNQDRVSIPSGKCRQNQENNGLLNQ